MAPDDYLKIPQPFRKREILILKTKFSLSLSPQILAVKACMYIPDLFKLRSYSALDSIFKANPIIINIFDSVKLPKRTGEKTMLNPKANKM